MKQPIFSILLVFLLLTLSLTACADDTIILRPGPDDLTESQLRETAARFFAVKCGFSKESLLEARMKIILQQSTRLRQREDGKKVYEPAGDAEWLIHVQSFPGENGQHPGFHLLRLSRAGDLLSWSAHGGEHQEDQPDMMAQGSPATPLPTDALKEDVLRKAGEDLLAMYGVTVTDSLRLEAAFITHELFNDGRVPVWLVNVYEGDVWLYKGVYGHDGLLMSLVPASQDCLSYLTPRENFFHAVFGDDQMDKTVEAGFGYLPEEEIIAWLRQIAQPYEDWLKEHPYDLHAQDIQALMTRYADQLE